ncbi:hypothetical protein KSF_093390 [Reticulibacter mediterranei]|uniref:Uncharacterized protein n=1 Tax=Reticulibacter mediterranei TaxID=2778369 RepID=A0A8J3J1Y7_9CHLR|nr:hypothetical protein [Reticulibacter mediterranei]GHO99291.1 hypothetical protein KSF_093390 [Reticulibacter mediterranei]
MQEAVLPQLASWETFYVIVGTAAATLTGLMFVVATLVAAARPRVSSPGEAFAAFNTPSVVHFGAALLIAALLSAPWQAIWPVSLLLALEGLAGMSYVVIVLRRARHQHDYQPVLEDWIWHTICPFIAYTILLVAALLLPVDATLALFFIGTATILLLFIGIHNAWDNVTYIALEFSESEDTPQEK